MFDQNAFETLREYFSPDEEDRVLLDDLRPYLPPTKLLRIFTDAVEWWSAKDDPDRPQPPENRRPSILEGVVAGRVLAESINATVFGWMITELRKEGLSWAEIGKALGVSKQSAWEKYQRHVANYDPQVWPRLHAEGVAALGTGPEDEPETVVPV